MILCREYRFIFIKGVKVAGTSIEIALSALCGPEDIVTPITLVDELTRKTHGYRLPQNYHEDPDVERVHSELLRTLSPGTLVSITLPKGRFYNHMPLTEVAANLGGIPDDYLIICAERCPYRKVISWANLLLGYDRYELGGEMRSDMATLRSFIDQMMGTDRIRESLNIERYRLEDGRFGPHVTMRYESLDADFGTLMRRLGVTDPPPLPHAKKGLLSNELAVEDLFKPWHIRKINETFAEEFEQFGYEMIPA